MDDRRKFCTRLKPLDSLGDQRGFTLIQMAIAVAIIGVFTVFALISISRARAKIALDNSVRQLASYIEKARLDAVRRHVDPVGSPSTTSKVYFTNSNTYSVQMDFSGTGSVITRSFTMEPGVIGIPAGSPLPTVTFNWRGRTSNCTTTFALFSDTAPPSTVDVSDAGEVTIDSDVDVLPTVSYNTANPTIDVSSALVVSGTASHNNTVDCSTSGGGASGPPVSGGGSGGCPSWTVNPSSMSIRKNGGSSGTIGVTVSSAAVVSASAPSNLRVTPSTQSLYAGSTGTFSVTSLDKTRGTFSVTFTLPCASPGVLVKVTN